MVEEQWPNRLVREVPLNAACLDKILTGREWSSIE